MTATDSRRVSSAGGPLEAAPAVDSALGPGPAEPSPEPAPAPEERSRATRVADGAWLGGVAITAGLGWTSTGWVGALLGIAGLGMFAWSLAVERRTLRTVAAHA